jgi:O-antigen/teichoic acid export membrane protein
LNKIKKLAGQTAIYGLSSIIGRMLNYLLVPLYVRVFTQSEYGVVTELYAYVSLIIIILTYGLETGFFKFAKKNQIETNKVYSTTLISIFTTSLIFVGFILLFKNEIASFIGYSEHPEYILWFGLVIAADAFTSIPFAYLRHENKALKFATIKLINIGLNIGLNLFFIVLCPYLDKNYNYEFIASIYNSNIGVGYIFIANLISSLLTFVLLLGIIPFNNLNFDRKLLRKILIFSLPLMLSGLAGMMNETIDRVLLKHFLIGTHEAIMSEIGIYGANYKIAILMTIFIQMFRYAAEPFFFSNQKENKSDKLYADVMKYFIIFGLLIFLGVNLYIDIIKHFVSEDYFVGLKIVPIVLAANLFVGINYNLSIWYKFTSKTVYAIYLNGIGAIITIVLNIIFIPIYGYLASAWATFICYLAIMILSYFLSKKYYPVNYDLKSIFLYSAIAIIIFFGFYFTYIESIYLKLGLATLLMTVFILIVFIKERKQLKADN